LLGRSKGSPAAAHKSGLSGDVSGAAISLGKEVWVGGRRGDYSGNTGCGGRRSCRGGVGELVESWHSVNKAGTRISNLESRISNLESRISNILRLWSWTWSTAIT